MTQSLSIRTRSPEETERMAARLGEKLEAPLIFLLNGGLGAGKTAFSKAFAKGAGSTDDTASPTYTIAATYDSPRGPTHHFDLYRLADPDELYETGFDDYLEDETAFLLVEWPEKAELNGPSCVYVDILADETAPDERTFTFTGEAPVVEAIGRALGIADEVSDGR